MAEQDLAKLIYQNEFGCGHFIKNTDASLKLINNEFKYAPKTDRLFEDIGNGYVRLYISALNEENFDAEILNALFIKSADFGGGSKESLINKLYSAGNVISKEYIEKYINAGCPMVSHSNSYRKAYSPAYRVLKKGIAELYIPFVSIKKASDKRNLTIAFDGKAAAGKTTAAEIFKFAANCRIIHADDFFLPLGMRTKERLNSPGGNIHYERLKDEVINNLGKNILTYGKFDCSTGKITEHTTAVKAPVTIIEGAYSTHPFLGDIYDFKVFFDIETNEQERRILSRNGKVMLKKFKDIWIPMENRYFEYYGIKYKCDFVANA